MLAPRSVGCERVVGHAAKRRAQLPAGKQPKERATLNRAGVSITPPVAAFFLSMKLARKRRRSQAVKRRFSDSANQSVSKNAAFRLAGAIGFDECHQSGYDNGSSESETPGCCQGCGTRLRKSDMSERLLPLLIGQDDRPPAFQFVTSGWPNNLKESRAVRAAFSLDILYRPFLWRID